MGPRATFEQIGSDSGSISARYPLVLVRQIGNESPINFTFRPHSGRILMILRGCRSETALNEEPHMQRIWLITGVAGAVTVMGLMAPAVTWAQDRVGREAEIVGLHQLCDRGDRKACVRFGMLLGESKERHVEWRRLHPDWWWWER